MAGLEIDTLAQQAERDAGDKDPILVADRRLFLDPSRERLIEAGHEDAAYLLAAPGHRIPRAEAKRLNLVVQDDRIVQAPAKPLPTKEPTTDTVKQHTPVEDKQRAPAENKGGKARG